MHPAKKQAWVNSSYGFVALFYIFLTTSPSAAGTTLGPVRNVVFMGRPFVANIEVGDSDQSLSCIQTELRYGENAVAGVRYTLQDNTIRIRSDRPIDEPLLSLSVTVNCSNPVTRSYTIFPEAPILTGSTSSIQTDTNSNPNPSSASAYGNQNFFGIENSPTGDYIAIQKQPEYHLNREPKPAINIHKKTKTTANQDPLANTLPHLQAALQVTSNKRSILRNTPSKPTHIVNPYNSADKPRLELDDFSWVNDGLSLHGSSEMLSAPTSNPAIREAARIQWANIDAQITGNTAEKQANLEQIASLSERLQSKEREIQTLNNRLAQQQALSRRIWEWLLYGVLGLLGLYLIFWLRTRITKNSTTKDQKSQTEKAPWWQPRATENAPPASDSPPGEVALKYRSKVTPKSTDSMLGYLEELPVPEVQFGGTNFGDFPEFAMHETPPLERASAPKENTDSHTQKAITLLQDIHQEADFSVALGQYDKAEGLLRQFIQKNPATSPLAYLNLLSIYHAAGNHAAFHSLRQHFNHTFNAQVPDFEDFKSESRGLESYPKAVAQMQLYWGSSRVIQYIEDLLFRRGDSSDETEAFSPIAYRELLLLYGIAMETSATADDLTRIQGMAANADRWLQPSTIFLGEKSEEDVQHPPQAEECAIDLPLELTPALDTGISRPAPQTEEVAAIQKPRVDLDFDLDSPIELDLPLLDDFPTPPHDFTLDSSLDLEIPDSDPVQQTNTNAGLDFELDSLDPPTPHGR